MNDVWFPPYEEHPHYVRAAAEMGVLLGLGTIYYWARPAINRYDWDLPTLTDRLTFQAVRFDNNSALTNFLSHPFAGSTFYGAARLNGLSVAEGALYAMTTSAFWEYVLEFREQVSINDMIFTPAAGIPIGAFLTNVTDYLTTAPGGGTGGQRVFASSLGLPRKLHSRAIDPNHGHSHLPPDSLGFSSAYWHRFRLGYEYSGVNVDQHARSLQSTVTADGEMVALAGFLRPGRFDKVFAADTFTELHGRIGVTPGVTNIQLRSSATLVGAYQQDFRTAPRGATGNAQMIGLATSARYVETAYAGHQDMYASTTMFGLSTGLWAGMGPLQIRVLADARYDFAAVHSLALRRYTRAFGDEDLKSVLTVQGYQFEMGPSARIRGRLEILGFSANAYAEIGEYNALNALDRTQETTRDVRAYDHVFEYGASASYEPFLLPLFVGVAADWVDRRSVLGPFSVYRLDTRLSFTAGLAF